MTSQNESIEEERSLPEGEILEHQFQNTQEMDEKYWRKDVEIERRTKSG